MIGWFWLRYYTVLAGIELREPRIVLYGLGIDILKEGE